MSFKPGSLVSFLNEARNGTVKSLYGGRLVVVDDLGFEWECDPSEVVLANPKLHNELSTAAPPLKPADQPKEASSTGDGDSTFFRKVGQTEDGDALIEVDLHIHELIESNRYMSNYEMLKLQMAHFERMMQTALREKYRKVVFIHGVGQGVLKAEIIKALGYYPNCKWRPADFRRYGTGATEVLLWYN